MAKLPSALRQSLLANQGKRKRIAFEQEEGAPPAPESRSVRARTADPNALAQENPLGNGQILHPVPAVDHQDSAQGVQSYEGSLSSSSPLVSARNAGPNSDLLSAWKPPRADREPIPTLTEVNPESGSISGGPRIWLKGMDFPALFPLYVRFGDAVVPTVSPKDLLFGPHLIKSFRLSLPTTSLPVICPPQPRQAPSMLRYQNIPSQMRLSMERVSRGFSTWEIMIYCMFPECTLVPALI